MATAESTIAVALALGLTAALPPVISTFGSIPGIEYLVGTLAAMIGSAGWQFILAGEARQKAADTGTAHDKLPTIDLVMVGYGLFSAPLAAGAIVAIVHALGGSTNFLSGGVFMVGGAAGPMLVRRTVALLLGMLPKPGGSP